ncbi:MAG: DNA-directed DNA polymerase II small subunit [Candidatus Micrarchaeota archaeon]|nr:DNA-directed DNA polymerase II small subunit [Candidatus Micrarchaeota archaeon]
MAVGNAVRELASRLGKTNIILAGDVDSSSINNLEIELIASKLIERHRDETGIVIVGNEELRNLAKELELEKAPMTVEVIPSSDYKPIAADVDARYSISNKPLERAEGTVDDFVQHFRSRLARMREMIEQHRGSMTGLMPNIESLKAYTSGRDVTIMGLISNKITTKNGNIMAVLEDETGEAKVIFMNSPSSKALFESARSIVNDEAVAIKGKISGPFVIAKEIVWPDVPIKQRGRQDEDIAIAFVSDVHVGSKDFMDKSFSNLIKWLNGGVDGRKDLAGKVKYVVMAGDLVDGIGVYPNQDRNLEILDVYTQYRVFFNFISAIPDYIHVFLMPGNHDAVQRAEPQPQLGPDILGDFKADNVHVLPNPSFLTLHGTDILAYHGTSLDSVIASIPGMSYAQPEKAMTEILKRRHLSPIYGGYMMVPSKNDNLVIERVPDILNMGHVHKNGLSNYHGVDILNSGTWQGQTDYQLMQGHMPTPALLPVYETKKNEFTHVNFNK